MPGAETVRRMVAAPGSRPSAVSSNLRMWLPLVGLGLGILLGLLLNVSVTPNLAGPYPPIVRRGDSGESQVKAR